MIKYPNKRKPKSISKLLKEAQQVFNKWVRNRDSDTLTFTCISCKQVNHINQMDAGHYVPQHGGSYLRYHEWNVNGECKRCNCFDEFHLIGYRKNLIEKIGEKNVTWLEENRHMVKKWSRSELEEIIKKYS